MRQARRCLQSDGKIRVLFHLQTLAIGGLERKVTRLALGLDRRRFDPIVSYSREFTPHGEALLCGGVPVHRIVPGCPGQNGAREAVRQIRGLSPQIFHSFSCERNSHDVWAASEAATPVIITGRGNMRYWAAPGHASQWEFDRNGMTHFISACSEAVGRIACEAESIPTEKLAVIYNGVEVPDVPLGPTIREELTIPGAVFLAGYAAKYRELKDHKTLFDAWQKVVAARPDAMLVCCGEDDNGRLASLQEMLRIRALDRNVLLLKARQKMNSFYRGLDLYVHASRSEGFSNAILEAMSYRLPIVATAVGGTPEAIEDGVSGILVPPESRSIAEAIVKLAKAPEERFNLGRAAGERVTERFSLERMVSGYESLYVMASKSRLAGDLLSP